MAHDRWVRIEQLYHAALERPADDQLRWLAAACDDDGLRHEVEALMRYDAVDPGILATSALSVATEAMMRDEVHAMVGRRLGGYEVLAFLGAGGMGDVYRARDVRLDRDVALKVFEQAAALVDVDRIEAEARAASVLNHPHIVTIYGVGEDGDTAYIAMELVRGRTLREVLADGPLPPARVLEIATQLADAIAAAHHCGIVHGDLKPENVMISADGRVKVLDFGLATRSHERWTADVAVPAGRRTLVGTIGYMSPEQVRGFGAEPASDQFAFGIICHEMLTGRRPFAGTSRQETLAATASDEPLAARITREIPPPLAAIITRALEKVPQQRYDDSAGLVAALRDARADFDRTGADAHPSRRRILALTALAAFGVLTGGAAWRWWPRGSAHPSLAVLPFANPAQDENIDFLCDGITETLIRQLAQLPDLTVISRATSFTFRGSTADPRAIGQRLGVDATLNGTVTRRASRILITAELIESGTGARIWGAEFDRPATDVLAVQAEIARAILVEGMRLRLTPEQLRRLSTLLTDNPAAYELFLRGVHHLRLTTEDDFLAARALLRVAVEQAPQFALALVTLASTYSVMAVDGYEPPLEAWPESARLVARARAIDPDLPDAHAEAATFAFFYRWDSAEAERHWKRALASRSELQSELLTAYALQKWASGQPQAALEIAQAARQVDPLSAQAAVREADLLAAVGRLNDAANIYDRVVRDHPDDPRARFGLAEVRRQQGRFDDAIESRRLAHAGAGDESLDDLFARVKGQTGYDEIVRASASQELGRLASRAAAGGYVSALDRARAHAQLANTAEAFQYLHAAFDERAAGLMLLKVDPAWQSVRHDARFAAALARAGVS